MLGSPELTAGIPGEGELTTVQIKAWLDNPENLKPLEIDLPLGLNTGIQQAENVIDANPLSRLDRAGATALFRQTPFRRRNDCLRELPCARPRLRG